MSSPPIEILGLGLPRTGTQTLADALGQLGHGPVYHMREVDKNGHREQWIEAVDRKMANGEPYSRAEFDAILGSFRGICDVPGCIFVEELLAAYPNAKVILTVRPEDKWFDSIMSTLWLARSDPNWKSNPVPTLADRWHAYFWKSDFPRHGIQAFHDHNELVRKLVPSERLLEYSVSEGWGPLCNFLGCEEPAAETFPRSDDWATQGWKKVNKHAETTPAA